MELDEIFKEKKKKPAASVSAFSKFTSEFKKAWASDLKKPRSSVRYFLYEYEEVQGGKGIEVFRCSRTSVKARLFEDDCWILDRELYDLLIEILPKYGPYLRRQKNLINTSWLND